MPKFSDLPVELLSPIFSYLLKPHQLATVCQVSKTFYDFAIPRLYNKVAVFSWHKDVKTRVVQLFATLASCPHLAKHVRYLEIRDFDKNLSFSSNDRAKNVLEDVLRGLRNCVNLRSCTWTRHGSLTSEILRALLCASSSADTNDDVKGNSFGSPSSTTQLTNHGLRELEINGYDEGLYDRALLLGFVCLERISLIMPSAAVISLLPTWTALNRISLRRLTLVCKASPVVTDEVLVSLATSLTQLEELHLAGCPKVTHQGVWAILSSNTEGIVGLRLEGVSSRFDMTDFSRRCTSARAMRRLRSITLTLRQQRQPLESWLEDVLVLLAPAPLEVFQIYSLSAFVEAPVTDGFWKALVDVHGGRLTRFAVHRMLIGLDAIRDVCERCVRLEQLFIVIEPEALPSLGSALACAKTLRVIHINHPLEAQVNALGPVFVMSDALPIAFQCSPNLVQFGYNTKVWQVTNAVHVDQDGNITVQRKLSAYDSPDVPEAFLVVRT
ncbi:hypothetical protein AX17_001700 [Amanita inopinata Kibby_2008]|nr:hypothetical protein AX17_001700 [Amanita inopinata Kibby_2008]